MNNTTEEKDYSHLPYRPCVGLALFNSRGEVFIGERIDTPGAWQMPQGGIDEGEAIEMAALRELKEEIGTDRAEIIHIADELIRYTLPNRLIEKLWNGRFQGQAQRWVALRFTGEDSDIILDAWDHPEFSAWEWCALEKTLDRIVPFKREVYRQVIEGFSGLDI